MDILYKDLILNSPLAMYACDSAGHIIFFNAAAEKLWGRKPEVSKDRWCGAWKMYHRDGTPMQLNEYPMALTLQQGIASEGKEIIIETPGHEFKYVLVYPRPFVNAGGNVAGAYNTLVDISATKKTEEKQAMLSAIVESSDDAIISKTLEGLITSWNRGAEKIYGYTEAEIIGKPINILIPPDLQDEEKEILRTLRQGKKIDHFQTTRLKKNGEKVSVSITVSPVKDQLGHIIGASKIARDITDQLKKEEMITHSNKRLKILNSIGKTISGKMDTQSILQKVTDATTQITGAAFGAFFYNTIDEKGESFMLYTLSGAPREAFDKFGMPRNTAIFHPTFSGEGVVRVDDITKDPRYGKNHPHHGMPAGHLPVVSYLAVPVISASGEVIGGLFFGHPEAGVFREEHEDIIVSIASQTSVALDNSKMFEEIRALSTKKDEFIALASHELKTPLTTIKGYLQILQRTPGFEDNQWTGKMVRQVDKMTNLVSDLFDVSKIESGKLVLYPETFDLWKLIQDIIEGFQYMTSSHTLVFDSPCDRVILKADKQRVEQVILNLLTNAVKYSPGADTVGISLEATPSEVTVKVKDEGMGLTAEQQKKVFTRFYRADNTSAISGLGLGLYLSKQIIDLHGGSIFVTSGAGKGAEFGFTIPR